MRKGYLCADARLQSFEKGMLYCKLTVADAIQKGQLLVSLAAAENCCRSALVKNFSLIYGFACAEKAAFFANQKFFFCRKLF